MIITQEIEGEFFDISLLIRRDINEVLEGAQPEDYKMAALYLMNRLFDFNTEIQNQKKI